ncbi:MAG: SH3 domain-containing protein [Mogibacterium sp.]|nr:SH3 domain-containing protein [Mogibacterium sp.]
MKKGKRNMKNRLLAAVITAVMLIGAMPFLGSTPAFTASAASVTASGTINTSVTLRKSASSSSKKVTKLKKNASVTIQYEVFKSKKSTSSSDRWYRVTAGKKSGYVKFNRVKNIKYSNTQGYTTDSLNYRKGPATSFKKAGTLNSGAAVTILMTAKRSGSNQIWYKVSAGGKTGYVSGKYVRIEPALRTPTAAQLKGKSALAASLLTHPQKGGKARVVYTFTPDNCRKIMAVKGFDNAKVPQGFTFTGSEYYILYGMAAGQSIVKYSANGTRLTESKFSFCIGHPNGITWDPVTRLCYVFKGNQKTIYTYNPATNKFGKSKTPYSSSGCGYDKTTNSIYATSHTGIRAYSADGKFTHKKLFSRCSHGIFHYIQDCGAGQGYIFHGISGANKKTTNFLDIYRASDSAYLGSIKITIGEIESAVVGNDGFVQLLINTSGETDYIWRTPLNVNELKF